MMRNPELSYCLDSPYLWYEESASALVTKDLESADKFLKEMKGKKDALEQVNTAYQAMYGATQALVHSIGYKATGFRCILTVLNVYFVNKGLLEQQHVDHLLKAQKIEGTPDENFAAAEAYVEAVKSIVKK
jgi:uncharacterized protein (UPF0332 family)